MKKKNYRGVYLPLPHEFKHIFRIMKLTSIFITICISSLFAVDGHSQSAKVSVFANNMQAKEVINQIESQTDYLFVYNNNQVDLSRRVSVEAENVSILEALFKIFDQTEVAYVMEGNNILLMKKPKSLEKQQNARKITGIVTDKTGVPIIGANVIEKGTSNGVITDLDGNFSLKVSENATLLISYIGYKDIEIDVVDRSVFEITLKEDLKLLEEVVVVGYGTQKKANLTGVVEMIDGEKLMNRPVPNVTQTLQGQVSGATFTTGTNGFEPGATLNFQIRGQGNAYVLVDGVPSDINNVNPNDIESISVLKDAAAAAIYGAKASYGGVLVTLKSGKKSTKPRVSFGANMSIARINRLPETMDSYTAALALNEVSVNSGQVAVYTNETIDRILAYQAGEIDYETIANPTNNSWEQLLKANGNNFWFDDFYGNVVNNQENISIQGGSEKVSYFVSAGHLYNGSPLQYGQDDYRRINTNAKVDIKLTDWWDFSVNNRFSTTDRITPNMDKYYDYSLIFHQVARALPNFPKYSPTGEYTWRSQITQLEYGGTDVTDKDETTQRFATEIRPLKGLKINADYTIKLLNTRFTSNNISIPEELADGSFIPSSLTNPTNVRKTQSQDLFSSLNVYATYEFDFKKAHNFQIMAGIQQEQMSYESITGRKDDLITNNVPSFSTATGNIQTLSDKLTHSSTLGGFLRLNYNFKERYLLEFDGRYDGTSIFATGNRWGFFPSFSGGWVISKENFFEGALDKINNLKLRASWGNLGNQNVTAYQDLAILGMKTNLGWVIDGERPVYAVAPNLVNTNLTWEKSQTLDIGVDVGLLQNRLNVTADWYRRTTYDRLGPSEALPAVLGQSIPKKNNSELQTNGWELAVSWRDQINDDFSYSVSAMVWDYHSTITKYNNPTNILTTDYKGKNAGELWGYTTDGFIKTAEEAKKITDNKSQNYFYNGVWNTGDMKYVDLNGDGIINKGNNTKDDHGDLSVIGNTTPRYQFSLNLGAEYKDFDFNAIFQGVGKRDMWFSSSNNMFWGYASWSQSSVFLEHADYYRDTQGSTYIGLGENTDAYYPRPYSVTSHNNKNRQVSTGYLQSAAYLRLKNLQLGYTLPKELTSKLSLQNVRLYFSADNLWTLTGEFPQYMDPENADKGAHGGGKSMNAQSNYSFGLNVQF